MIEKVIEKGSIPKLNDTNKMGTTKKPLSFSISRILEEPCTKPAAVIESRSRDTEEPRVPVHFGTIHHYASQNYGQSSYDYAQFGNFFFFFNYLWINYGHLFNISVRFYQTNI